MVRAAKSSSKPSTPKAKDKRSGSSSTSTPRSTSSRRAKGMVKSFRESPSSEEDESDADEWGVSPFKQGSQRGSDTSKSDFASQDEDSEDEIQKPSSKKQKQNDGSKKIVKSPKANGSASKGRERKKVAGSDRNRRIITELVKAPKEEVPANQISIHLMKLMTDLCDPEKNDRDWFRSRVALWKYVKNDWNAFVATLLEKLMEEVDETIPLMLPKDLVFTIYRDAVRAPVPLRTQMRASFGRGGMKNMSAFADYYVQVGKGQVSVEGGWYEPSTEHLAIIRKHIIDNTEQGRHLKAVVSSDEFVQVFGMPRTKSEKKKRGEKNPQNKKVNLWGSPDELKTCPRMAGVTVDHPEIEWLKLKSFWVEVDLPDEAALEPDFQDRICKIALVIKPLVHALHDMVYPPPPAPED